MILCLAKMPFIPPVSIACSGQAVKERPNNKSASLTTMGKTKGLKEDKGNSVKERLTLNLKQLGKKSPPRSHLPAAKRISGMEMSTKRKDCLLPSSQTSSSPASSPGESISKTQQLQYLSPVKSEHEVKMRSRKEEETHFTLTLTPEVVVLLQRRNSERHQRSASSNPGTGPSASGSVTDTRRRRENASKRQQPATQRTATPSNRAVAKHKNVEVGDISSIVKISLLNEHHRYDDVEYEEENYGLDERVVLKCTEWLRGLEHTP
uniref:Si:dkeyp-57d7.4 n=1 Tax=Gouania willdenowi TaxID=441366 RepID=A0A8C5G2P3_GOUWI